MPKVVPHAGDTALDKAGEVPASRSLPSLLRVRDSTSQQTNKRSIGDERGSEWNEQGREAAWRERASDLVAGESLSDEGKLDQDAKGGMDPAP